MDSKGVEAREAANKNNTKSNSNIRIKSKDSHRLLSDEEQSNRFVEHFQVVGC